MSDIFNKYLRLTMVARDEPLHETLSTALRITKAYNARTTLEFPKGYSIEIYPDSSLNDIKKIEELTFRLWQNENK